MNICSDILGARWGIWPGRRPGPETFVCNKKPVLKRQLPARAGKWENLAEEAPGPETSVCNKKPVLKRELPARPGKWGNLAEEAPGPGNVRL